nr:hypothetical protein [Tanacetum cinerariifolium]
MRGDVRESLYGGDDVLAGKAVARQLDLVKVRGFAKNGPWTLGNFASVLSDLLEELQDIFVTTYVELYTYLKSYEPHALKNLKKQEQSSSIVDPLAYLASTTHHLMPTQPTNPPPSTSSLTLPPQPAAQSSNDAMLATMNQIRKALGNVGNIGTRGTQSYRQVFDNKGKFVIGYNCHGEGHMSRQCKEKKREKDSQYFKDKMLLMEAKEKGAVLDAEAEAFLADVEYEGPHAAAAFISNLSSTSGTNGATTSYVNEVHTDDNQIFDNVNHLLAHEMHQEEHLDFDVKSNIDDNTIPYHQYQLDSEVQDVPTEEQGMVNDSLRAEIARSLGSSNPWYAKQAKIAQPTLYDGHALLKPTNTPVRVHGSEESLVQAQVSRTKMSNRPRTIKPINYAELNALYSHFVPHKEVSQEQVYWLPAEELATQKSNTPKPEQLQGKNDTIRKFQTQINSMSMLNVEPTVGVKPATRTSKPMSKSDTQNHSTLPAKREKARRVKDHHRNLNKQNHVDSHLNVKLIGFVSNSNTVYNACNESLVFANHDNFVVHNLKSMNVKTPTTKRNVKTTKKVWKAKVVTIRS